MVARFVSQAREEGLLHNTAVVIIGDHLAMSNPLHAQLDKAAERSIFNLFVGDAGMPAKATDDLLPFDLYPTILQFIGLAVPDGRLGLGYGAFATQGIAQVRSAEDRADLLANVMNSSDRFSSLWRPTP